jgi:sporulation protein YlmC with PRC-barrel domain
MARYSSIVTILAATALIAGPVLAQPPASSSAAPQAPATTTDRPARALVTPSNGPAAAAGGSTYFTADHQLRASKIVGASVYDDHNQSVGSIDDVLMSEGDHKVASAVISVGGFLGIRSKLVAVPFEKLQMVDDKIVLSGATKASLEGMAEYHYTNA